MGIPSLYQLDVRGGISTHVLDAARPLIANTVPFSPPIMICCPPKAGEATSASPSSSCHNSVPPSRFAAYKRPSLEPNTTPSLKMIGDPSTRPPVWNFHAASPVL